MLKILLLLQKVHISACYSDILQPENTPDHTVKHNHPLL